MDTPPQNDNEFSQFDGANKDILNSSRLKPTPTNILFDMENVSIPYTKEYIFLCVRSSTVKWDDNLTHLFPIGFADISFKNIFTML